MDEALLRSTDHTWQTPENVLGLVRALGEIDLDPCTVSDNPIRAHRFYTPVDNGLAQPWTASLVFVNPPYGRELPKWVLKSCQEFGQKQCSEIVFLSPARTDTRWFGDLVKFATSIGFWRGRMTFKGAPAPAPFPSCLTYFGPRADKFESVFGSSANVWRLR